MTSSWPGAAQLATLYASASCIAARDGLWPSATNIRIEVLCDDHLASAIAEDLQARYYERYGIGISLPMSWCCIPENSDRGPAPAWPPRNVPVPA
ncbi:MAG: hypothetical protein WCC44_02985 [Azonexus sp.]